MPNKMPFKETHSFFSKQLKTIVQWTHGLLHNDVWRFPSVLWREQESDCTTSKTKAFFQNRGLFMFAEDMACLMVYS